MGLAFWLLVLSSVILEFINCRGLAKPLPDWRQKVADAPDEWKAFNMSMLGPWSAWRVSPLNYCETTELPRADKSKIASEVYLHGPHKPAKADFAAEVVGPWPGALEDPRLAYDSHGALVMSMALFNGTKSSVQITWPSLGLHVRVKDDRPQKNWVPVERPLQHMKDGPNVVLLASVPQSAGSYGSPIAINRPNGPPGTALDMPLHIKLNLGHWRGSTNFMQGPDGLLVGLVHRRYAPSEAPLRFLQNRGLPLYDHAVQLLEPVWPFKCVKMSRPFQFKIRGFSGPQFVFPMSMDRIDARNDNDKLSVRVSFGISDCYAAFGTIPIRALYDMVNIGFDTLSVVLNANS